MKKNIKLLLIIALLLLPGTVYGLSATPSISCSNEGIAPGGSTKCTVYVTVNSGGLKGIDAKVSVSSGLTLSNLAASSGWNGSASGNRILLYTDSKKTGKVSIASFNVKANSSVTASQTISLTNIGYSDENDNDLSGSSINKTLKIYSSNNNLASLSLSNGTLTPSFSSNTTSYTVTIDEASTVITATAQDSKAKVSGTGTKKINYGTNTFTIVVTAESGAKKTYTITVTRPDNRSKDNTLKDLKVSNTDITFDKNKTSYSTVVENDTSTVNITATANDTKAKVSGTGTKTLKVGTNTFTIVVTAENGSTRKYTVTINRKNANGEIEKDKNNMSSNNYLKTIKIDKYNLKFNKNTLSYNIVVDDEVDKISINYETEDSKASATIDNDGTLKLGNNTITITVVAENGSSRKYVLNVRRGNYVSNNEKDIIAALKDEDGPKTIKVKVDSEDDTKNISSTVIDLLNKSDKELVFVVSKEDQTTYTVKINKNNINNYNYELLFVSEYEKDIKTAANNNKYLSLVVKNNNGMSIKATFNVYVGDKDIKGLKELDLYYYDDTTKKLVLLEKGIKVDNDYVELELDNNHNYVLLGKGAKLEKIPFMLYVDILLLIIVLVLAVIVIKRKLIKEK